LTHVVIGSNCFTGSHIVDGLLEDGATDVIGVSRSPEYADLFLPYKRWADGRFRFHQLDMVRDFAEVMRVLDRAEPEVVINVAALSEVALSNTSPVEYFDINTRAVVRLCNELRTRPYLRSYVHISSAEIFGTCPDPVDEDALFAPSTPYAVSKAAADMYLAVARRHFGFPVTIIRSTNVYGKHQQLFKIIPRTAIYLKMKRPIELHGGGRSAKSFIHVRDVVRGLKLALARGLPETYHFTVQSDQTVADVVRCVCDRMGYNYDEAVHVVGERLGQDARYLLDCEKATRTLEWSPREDFVAGIDEVIAWIDANWQAIQRAPLEYRHKV
jgi:dTDP-glucose 4,6-dehydratase